MIRCSILVLALAVGSSSTALAQTPPTPASASTPTGFAVHAQAPQGLDDIYEFYGTNYGFVPNLAKVMSGSPALMRSYLDTQNNLKDSGKLSPAEINVVQMAIAVENKCEYCTAGHTMAGKSFFKTPMEHMESVRMRRALKEPKLNALRNFAILVYAKKGEVTPAEFSGFLAAGYTRAQALDVVACVAAKVMSNYTNSLAKTPIDPPLQPLAKGLPFAGK